MRLLGSHGFLTVNEDQPVMQYWGGDENQKDWSILGEAGEVAFATEIREFIRDRVLEDRQPLYTINDAWATMALIEAAYSIGAAGPTHEVAQPDKALTNVTNSRFDKQSSRELATVPAASYFKIQLIKCN